MKKLSAKKDSSNQLFSNFSIVKPIISRNLCQVNFPHAACKKFSLTEKKFRQINSLVISLVKPLLPRNFCEKVREFL